MSTTKEKTITQLAPKIRRAHDALKAAGCPVFIRDESADPVLCISAERTGRDDEPWAEYYPDLQSYPWENPKIEQILEPLGLHAEWDNPGSMSIWD